jgi:hypothetical protein
VKGLDETGTVGLHPFPPLRDPLQEAEDQTTASRGAVTNEKHRKIRQKILKRVPSILFTPDLLAHTTQQKIPFNPRFFWLHWTLPFLITRFNRMGAPLTTEDSQVGDPPTSSGRSGFDSSPGPVINGILLDVAHLLFQLIKLNLLSIITFSIFVFFLIFLFFNFFFFVFFLY